MLQKRALAARNDRRPDTSMSMKLLFVNSSLTDGGSEKAMSLVAQALVQRGHSVTMALVRDKERTYHIDPRISMVQFRNVGGNRFRKALDRISQTRNLIKIGDYDYVVCYMWDLNLTTLIASLGLQSRVIVSERAFPGSPERSRIARRLESMLYQLAHRIVYQTSDAQEFCEPNLKSRSVVVPNIIDTNGIEPYEGERTQRIVSVGRLGTQKNFPLLLKAFARFHQSNPNWTLEIYGKGALEVELRALVAQLGIANSVKFAGYVSDIAARIRDAGMFALSSDFEGISNAMSEAMALGLPVVCTDCPVGGARLLIQDRVSGILVPVRDEDALAGAMCEVAGEEALANTISAGALASVARFTPKQLVLVWEEYVLC